MSASSETTFDGFVNMLPQWTTLLCHVNNLLWSHLLTCAATINIEK